MSLPPWPDWTEAEWRIAARRKTAKDAFDESKHPRNPEGTKEGGQFTESGHSGVPTSDPLLAVQAKAGIAAVEKLLPAAIRTADWSKVEGAWEHLKEDAQEKVRERFFADNYKEISRSVSTSDLDYEVTREIAKGQAKELDAARDNLLKAYPQLDPGTVWMDPNTDWLGNVQLEWRNIRLMDGSAPKPMMMGDIRLTWQNARTDTIQAATEAYQKTDAYKARREELVQEALRNEWKGLDPEGKLSLALNMRLVGELPGDVMDTLATEPKHWVSGVKEGTHEDEDYAHTAAVAKRLTVLRTDEIRAERGLQSTLHPQSISSEQLIHDVWQQWVRKSSAGISVSLQLAAARELGGVHRLTKEEVEDAIADAEEYGGIETMQAYVRAQWEVNQLVLQKAGEDKVSIYRGLKMPGSQIDATTNREVNIRGDGPIAPPSNVKIEQFRNEKGDVTSEVVTFHYNGRDHEVPKDREPAAMSWDDADETTKKQVKDLWMSRVTEHIAKTPPENPKMTPEQGEEMFDRLSDYGKYNLMFDWRQDGSIPPLPFQSTERTIQKYMDELRVVGGYDRDLLMQLPDLQLQRAGAASTTGTLDVANEWGGIPPLPLDPVRVVLRIETPPTSILSLPIYGANTIGEHEVVVLGTKDKWVWDAWREKAPTLEDYPIVRPAKKAESQTLVIDLQAEDRGKPHWMSTVDWSKVEPKS